MPGVEVTTATRSGTGPSRAPSGQFFVVGLTGRGDTTAPILVKGMADVETLIGPRTTYGAVWDQLKTFFDEGGLQAYVVRVIGEDADKGFLSLNDRAGTPIATLRFEAKSEGSWSSGLTVQVADGSLTNTFRITLRLNGDVVSDYNNLTSPAVAVAKFAGNPYVNVTNLGSASAAPTNNPAVLAATPLSAGDDDRAAVVTADYVAALDQFVPGLGDGAVAIPGQTGDDVWNGIIAHCEANNRIGLLAGSLGDTKDVYVSNASSLDTEFAGLFGPFLIVSDGGTGTRTISPEGYVAACRSRAHEAIGPWRAPAGAMGKSQSEGVLGVETSWSKEDSNELDAAKVSVIRVIANSIRLYGWRSLSDDIDNYAYLKDRDLLNRLVVEAEKRLEDYVFETIDGKGQLLAAINAELVGMVDPIRQAGGLFENYDADGRLIDPGYKVNTGRDINSTVSLANNEVKAVLSVRVSPTGALVSLNIVKVGILADV